MVSVSLDFYKLKEEVRREIINRIDRIEISNYPLEGAWLLYGLSFDGIDNNPFFKKGIHELERWALSEVAGGKNKDLGPLSLCGYLSMKKDVENIVLKKVENILQRVEQREGMKFCVLNDPEQIFCVSLLKDKIGQDRKTKLVEIIKKNLNGRIARKVLFISALLEFNEDFDDVRELKQADNVEDVILILWLCERYRKKLKEELLTLWKTFESIYPQIKISRDSGHSCLSNKILVFLYEAITNEIKEPDPNMLFELYPIHPEIKKVSYDHFKNKKYVSAVFEATKKLNEMIQNLTGIKNKNETELVQATMKQISDPKNLKIIFNNYTNEESGKNEQKGLALITEGIFNAFRNPKGHKPEDHPLVGMVPYEALDQLIIISYICKRIENAKINKED